jgi:hypothetical protein
MRARSLLAALAVPFLLATGCTEKVVEPPPPSPIVELEVPDSIQAIFTANCFGSFCHNSAPPAGDQSLVDARTSWLNIVDVASTEKPEFKRIAPGDSANSYVVMKLRGDSRIVGGRMPLGRPGGLDPVLILRIASWAQQGAPGTPITAIAAHQASDFSTSTKVE